MIFHIHSEYPILRPTRPWGQAASPSLTAPAERLQARVLGLMVHRIGTCQARIQWIGLRENLQETMVFNHQISGFPVNFPIIQFYEGFTDAQFTGMVHSRSSHGFVGSPGANGWLLLTRISCGSNMKEHLVQMDGLHDLRKSERLVYGLKQSSHGVVPLPGSVSSCRRFAAMILGCLPLIFDCVPVLIRQHHR